MVDSSDILEPLTDAQREAVTHVDGPLLILAGPGSGKTRVVTHRIAYLLDQGVPAHNILGLTFTNKAAGEMAKRLEGLRPGRSVWLSTFHRWCASLLRRYADFAGLAANFTIYDAQDSLTALKRAISGAGVSLGTQTPDRILREISNCKNALITPEQYAENVRIPNFYSSPIVRKIVEEAYPAYQAYLKQANAVDFDDLLFQVALMFTQNEELRHDLDNRCRYILVDEYQDTNQAQYVLVRALSLDYPNLAATGDPDQSIYGWRGANINNILNFERDFSDVHVVRLEQNYRSTPPILQVADTLIEHNKLRKRKTLYTHREGGVPVRLAAYYDQDDEARSIANTIVQGIKQGRSPAEFAVFYRINALSRAFEFALRERNIPYQVVSGLEFFQRKEVKDCLAYLQLLNNPRDDVSLLRIINVPARRIGKATIERLVEYAHNNRLSLLDAARESGLISTIKKASAVHVVKFAALIDRLREHVHAPVEEILGHILTETGIKEMYADSDDPLNDDRLANIEELLTAAKQFDSEHSGGDNLQTFLEQALLINDTDAWDADADRVTLMTLHAAKGLEFPTVFVTAVEQNLLPHERSLQDDHKLEEERRLLFVGITRAMQELQLSYVRMREFRGAPRMAIPSPFLLELPRHEMQMEGGVSQTMMAAATLQEISSQRHRVRNGDAGPYGPDSEDGSFEFHERHEETFTIEPFSDEHEYEHQSGPAVEEFTEELPSGDGVSPRSGRRNTQVGSINTSISTDLSRLKTAAELHGTAPAAESPTRVDPNQFQQGMTVQHPEYGLGKIIAMSGKGNQRTATINFATGPSSVRFVLVHSKLKPIG